MTLDSSYNEVEWDKLISSEFIESLLSALNQASNSFAQFATTDPLYHSMNPFEIAHEIRGRIISALRLYFRTVPNIEMRDHGAGFYLIWSQTLVFHVKKVEHSLQIVSKPKALSVESPQLRLLPDEFVFRPLCDFRPLVIAYIRDEYGAITGASIMEQVGNIVVKSIEVPFVRDFSFPTEATPDVPHVPDVLDDDSGMGFTFKDDDDDIENSEQSV